MARFFDTNLLMLIIDAIHAHVYQFNIGSDLILENDHKEALSHRSLRWVLPNIPTLVDPLCDTKRPNAAVHSILQSHKKKRKFFIFMFLTHLQPMFIFLDLLKVSEKCKNPISVALTAAYLKCLRLEKRMTSAYSSIS